MKEASTARFSRISRAAASLLTLICPGIIRVYNVSGHLEIRMIIERNENRSLSKLPMASNYSLSALHTNLR